MRLSDGITLNIDVAEWMRRTGRFDGIRPSDGREWIEARCPFHDDRHASFAVHAENGHYRCLACGVSGTFVKLVKEIEGHDTLFDAEQHLLATHGRFVPDDDEPLELEFGDGEEETNVLVYLAGPETTPRAGAYLLGRGIEPHVQGWFEAVEIDGVVDMPWRDAGGRAITVKKRRIDQKSFWYDPPVKRLDRHLYGFHLAKTADLIVVCEGEIDAMSVVQSKLAAVALGGSNVSNEQATLLRNAKADEIVVFTDNDKAGRKARTVLTDKLCGFKCVSCADWSLAPTCKDANDVLRKHGTAHLRVMIENRVPIGLSLKLA